MDISNETLFYCGIAVSSVSFLCLMAGLIIIKFKSMSLEHRFDEEYGKETKNKE